jgi:hypothetical protein
MTLPMLEHFNDLLADRAGPCISIYLPTGRRSPDKQHDVLSFKAQLEQVETSLSIELPEATRAALMAPLYELVENERFWAFTLTGLAVLRAGDFFKVYKLQRSVPERTIVADSFHIKPLLRITQSADRFEVLALTREHVRYFHGNRDALDEVELHPDIPRTLKEALGEQLTEQHETSASVGKQGQDGGDVTMRFGIGGRKDEIDKDIERFFRVIDRAILEHHSKPSGLPLMIAALAEYHTTFRTLSHNPQLLAEGITGNPTAFTADELRERAWAVFEPRYHERLNTLLEEFGTNRAHDLGSDVIADVALAALGGRVRTMLVDADTVVPGRVDRDTGQVHEGALSDLHTDDVLDDLAELTLRMGGDVVVVPPDRMPTKTGVAAIYRF